MRNPSYACRDAFAILLLVVAFVMAVVAFHVYPRYSGRGSFVVFVLYFICTDRVITDGGYVLFVHLCNCVVFYAIKYIYKYCNIIIFSLLAD